MPPENTSIVIIGAGPAGIGMAVELLRRGITDFTVLEKADAVGGTWRDNRYPGVACDVPALYYGYSFAPNTAARSTFASGAELLDYFQGVASANDVLPHVHHGVEVASAVWDGTGWDVESTTGERWHADIVITAVGRLHRPRFPDIPGLADFTGLLAHSAQWDPTTDLHGRRLGIIGTGSSAVQMVVGASPVVEHLDLFQRTPQWVYPLADEPLPEQVRAHLAASPEAARAAYDAIEKQIAAAADAMVNGDQVRIDERDDAVRAALAGVRDPELRRKLTPGYEIGCKRLVVSGKFYDAVQQENVELVTEGIERIEADGVRTVDGVLHRLDTLILATGFRADAFLRPMRVVGEDGVDLDTVWADTFTNYKSVAIPHMPNFFTINGPFSPGGSLSILTVIEQHIGYVLQLVDTIRAQRVAVVPDTDRTQELFDEVREKATKTVWFTGGCQSWYLGADGLPIVAPLTLDQLREDMRRPVLDDFDITPLPAGASS
ncbi:flavin-containing monooxygenase [Klenkia brasiliensis]|uniref:Predicted flavoprotein CzcO associated with the cation diffusion facilitator CzcD n=1 Tax=Klenkia brasiliensis TaxID=333142 RepID=A0A1G8ABK0_9ACTN|nr:NAD(P)/FAD-dependent oxidoreductase [Klenkia brasiliensis]SDH18318.1 Predicted flavoprotein CzcO associated with the cation diffusion facilitator CzcD [Klenkia brasiliensis]